MSKIKCQFTKTVLTVLLRLGPGLIILHFDHCSRHFGRLTCSRLQSEHRENKDPRQRGRGKTIICSCDVLLTFRLYSPSPVWYLVQSLRTDRGLGTAESPGWTLWTAWPHLEEVSHDDTLVMGHKNKLLIMLKTSFKNTSFIV